jgi:general secretion pathway protein D
VYPRPESLPLAKADEEKKPELRTEIYRGTGVMVRPPAVREGRQPAGGEVVLNFENADLREVVKVILGDMLGENFVIDPQVRGAVTVQTSRPLSREALLPTLETLLRMNGAALLRTPQGYQIRPLAAALQATTSPQLATVPTSLPLGYSVAVVPLRYVGVRDIQKLLEPFAPPGSVIRADEGRNVLVLAGTRQELDNLVETIRAFDVDWLAGMSVGMFPLKSTDAKSLAEELGQIFGDQAEGPLAGLVRIIPIERMNALLVVSSQAGYLDDVRNWVERLDRTTPGAGAQIFVYNVQNGKAEHLAEVLGGLFGQEGGTGRRGPGAPELAPGLAPGEIGTLPFLGPGAIQPQELGVPGISGGDLTSSGPSGNVFTPSIGQVTDIDVPTEALPGTTPSRRAAPGVAARGGTALGAGAGVGGVEEARITLAGGNEVRIIADKDNNALVILATPADYEKIEAAIRRLDIVPRQVLIEATIAEVTLTDNLSYGLQWWFKNNTIVDTLDGIGSLGFNRGTSVDQVLPNPLDPKSFRGFTYALADAGRIVHVLLTALAEKKLLNVLSSPHLMVLDNQEAEIRVGDQVPVSTASTVTGTGLTTQSVQLKDTGVTLGVRPRVNAGGLVTLELSQEVTDVGEIETTTNNRRFLQRSIKSNVAVQSGQTLVLGGLIRDNRSNNRTGVPLLMDVPVVGNLFSTTGKGNTRTELIVLITPRVVRDQVEAYKVTEEIKEKMRSTRRPLQFTGPNPQDSTYRDIR